VIAVTKGSCPPQASARGPMYASAARLDFLGEWQSCYGDARRGERHDNRRVPEQTLQVLRGEGHPVTLSLGTGLQNSVETLGLRPSHFKGQHLARHQFRHRPHRAFGQWPWYGYYDVPPYTSDCDMTFSTPETAVVAPTVGCQHSEQTVKVPSENGGARQVTILRC
jgi:hypothetical protein